MGELGRGDCCETVEELKRKHQVQCDAFARELQESRDEFRRDIAEIKTSVQGLLDAWNTATGLVKFIKWLGSIAFAIATTSALIKEHWHNGP